MTEHSPIEAPRAQKMRDDDWLRAMRKYADPEPAWADTDSEGTIAMLLDEAGAGKSVVMGDLLDLLAADGVSTLAMKADLQLSAVKSADDIQQRLQLPDSVERVVERLSHTGPVVVIVDLSTAS